MALTGILFEEESRLISCFLRKVISRIAKPKPNTRVFSLIYHRYNLDQTSFMEILVVLGTEKEQKYSQKCPIIVVKGFWDLLHVFFWLISASYCRGYCLYNYGARAL
ncbi:hypothetical protein CS542_06315 [Pedobacter sp. IW39]|nr:hypothetical protein CS542_06315 [Pedobacter sp. IW39]